MVSPLPTGGPPGIKEGREGGFSNSTLLCSPGDIVRGVTDCLQRTLSGPPGAYFPPPRPLPAANSVWTIDKAAGCNQNDRV